MRRVRATDSNAGNMTSCCSLVLRYGRLEHIDPLKAATCAASTVNCC